MKHLNRQEKRKITSKIKSTKPKKNTPANKKTDKDGKDILSSEFQFSNVTTAMKPLLLRKW